MVLHQELVKVLHEKGVDAQELSSIIYEHFVSIIEDYDGDEQHDIEQIIDAVSEFRLKYNLV